MLRVCYVLANVEGGAPGIGRACNVACDLLRCIVVLVPVGRLWASLLLLGWA